MELMKNLLNESFKSPRSDKEINMVRFENALQDLLEAYSVLEDHTREGSEFFERATELSEEPLDAHFKDIRMHLDALHDALSDLEMKVNQEQEED